MNKEIIDIYNLIQEISWHFGSRGFNGECCGDLSLVEFMALKKINECKEITIQEVGNAINFTKSGASKIIDRLENKGYVIRMNSPIDGRVCCVLTTEKGIETLAGIINYYTLNLYNILKGIEPQKVDQIRESLIVLVDALQSFKEG
ncbi:MAG: MarR family winged helix-turn-helix transcriptional regulator [Clostridia bacterium]|nr:MarR family winged helix-turn-helix transcriptional regulator [Clostridia bacterium]